jgi:hypothetical protein
MRPSHLYEPLLEGGGSALVLRPSLHPLPNTRGLPSRALLPLTLSVLLPKPHAVLEGTAGFLVRVLVRLTEEGPCDDGRGGGGGGVLPPCRRDGQVPSWSVCILTYMGSDGYASWARYNTSGAGLEEVDGAWAPLVHVCMCEPCVCVHVRVPAMCMCMCQPCALHACASHVYVCMCMCVCMSMCVCMCMCESCVCVHVHVHVHVHVQISVCVDVTHSCPSYLVVVAAAAKLVTGPLMLCLEPGVVEAVTSPDTLPGLYVR